MRFALSLSACFFPPLCLTLAGCAPPAAGPELQGRSKTDPTVRGIAHDVKEEIWPATTRAQGSLVSDEQTTVAFKVSGRLTQVYVDTGDVVRQGDLLAKLDQQDYELLVKQAEAYLVQARAAVGLLPGEALENFDPKKSPPVREAFVVWEDAKLRVNRAARLRETSAISPVEYDTAEAGERIAQARYALAMNTVLEKTALINVRTADLNLARQRLADTEVVAPFDGVVQVRTVSPGTFVQIGQTLMSIVRNSTLRFRGSIPERSAQLLRIGQSVDLFIESEDGVRQSTVTRINPTLDMQSRSLMFESIVDNHDGRLRAGLFAEGEVVLDPNAKVIAIPRSAIIRFAGVEKAWTIRNGQLMEQPLEIGREALDRVEVLEGLKAGNRILLDAKQGRVGKFEDNASETPTINGGDVSSTESTKLEGWQRASQRAFFEIARLSLKNQFACGIAASKHETQGSKCKHAARASVSVFLAKAHLLAPRARIGTTSKRASLVDHRSWPV